MPTCRILGVAADTAAGVLATGVLATVGVLAAGVLTTDVLAAGVDCESAKAIKNSAIMIERKIRRRAR